MKLKGFIIYYIKLYKILIITLLIYIIINIKKLLKIILSIIYTNNQAVIQKLKIQIIANPDSIWFKTLK